MPVVVAIAEAVMVAVSVAEAVMVPVVQPFHEAAARARGAVPITSSWRVATTGKK
jgi:hypothetical protein